MATCAIPDCERKAKEGYNLCATCNEQAERAKPNSQPSMPPQVEE